MEKVPFEGETMDQPNRKNIRYDPFGSVGRKSDPNAECGKVCFWSFGPNFWTSTILVFMFRNIPDRTYFVSAQNIYIK